MNARDQEFALLTRCAVVAQQPVLQAQDQREANVFRVASMVLRSRFPLESQTLLQASEQYFSQHPEDKLEAVEVVKKGWVSNLPRLRDMLTHLLHQ